MGEWTCGHESIGHNDGECCAVCTLTRERDEARKRLESEVDYSISLQRIIEALCHGTPIRDDHAVRADFHAKMATEHRAAVEARVAERCAEIAEKAELGADHKVRGSGRSLQESLMLAIQQSGLLLRKATAAAIRREFGVTR